MKGGFDPAKQVAKEIDKDYLNQLSRFIDMDIENIEKDVNKWFDVEIAKMTEEYAEKKRKGLEYFRDLKEKVKKRLSEL